MTAAAATASLANISNVPFRDQTTVTIAAAAAGRVALWRPCYSWPVWWSWSGHGLVLAAVGHLRLRHSHPINAGTPEGAGERFPARVGH